jgi:hypothetical protein
MPDDVRPPLPEQQAKVYPPELVENYMARFGLFTNDLMQRRIAFLVKAKIDSDIYIAQLEKQIAALEAKVSGLLGYIERTATKGKKVNA